MAMSPHAPPNTAFTYTLYWGSGRFGSLVHSVLCTLSIGCAHRVSAHSVLCTLSIGCARRVHFWFIGSSLCIHFRYSVGHFMTGRIPHLPHSSIVTAA